MEKSKTNYIVEIKEDTVSGSLNNDLFRVMCARGDVNSISVSELVGEHITITGNALADITVNDDVIHTEYFDTVEKGIIHCGSGTMFSDSVSDYIEYTNKFIIRGVKCKKGKGYKAVPLLAEETSYEN